MATPQVGTSPQAPAVDTSAVDIVWQNRLLPFMLIMLFALTGFFCITSAYQAYVVEKHIREAHEINLDPALLITVDPKASTAEQMSIVRWKTISLLESHALQSRYHQASVAVMSRVYIIFLGFVTGMALALVGSTFVLGKLKESPTQLEAGHSSLTFSLTTASPGLILVVLGTTLMICTLWARVDINVRDASLYIQAVPGSEADTSQSPARPATDILKSLDLPKK